MEKANWHTALAAASHCETARRRAERDLRAYGNYLQAAAATARSRDEGGMPDAAD